MAERLFTRPTEPARPPRVARHGRARRVVPPPSWTVLGMLLVVLAGVLFVGAYANAAFVPDRQHTDHGQTRVPADVVDGGPILTAADGDVRSYRLPARTLALTFDDGPDPTWTPEILRVLAKYDVPATFFVMGSQVARHPGLVRDMVVAGHEIGVHTFTHPDLATLPGWRRRLEYAQTQLALASAAGVEATLVRFPYSSFANAIDDHDWPLVTEAGDLGYLTVLNDTDSLDWERPGVDRVVANAVPPDTPARSPSGTTRAVTGRRRWRRWTATSR